MKQNITKEQWNELDDEKKDIIWSSLDFLGHNYITIGKMIEFLGSNSANIFFVPGFKFWNVTFEQKYTGQKEGLCDALWEAVKNKLNNILKVKLDLPKQTRTKEYFSLRKKATEEAIKKHKPTNWQNYSIYYEGNILCIEHN